VNSTASVDRRDVRVALPLWADPAELDEVNLDYAATTPALVAAVEAVQAAIPWYGSLHRGGGRKSAHSTTLFEESRLSVARFVGCDNAEDVVFVRNTTEAANLLAVALPPGTRVLCSPFEHHANLLPWRQHRVAHLPFTTNVGDFVEAAADALESAEREGDPFSLVAITGASNVTGEVPPITEIARLAHARGALVFVDAAQLAPHRRMDLHELEADFLAFSGHKVYAPFGTGVLVSPADGLANGSPLLHGGGAVRIVTLEGVAWAESPRRYEAGTPNLLGAVALGASCNALTSYGMTAIAEHERQLASMLWAGLDAIGGVQQLHQWTDAPDRVGVAAFTAEGWAAHELGTHLADRGIAVRAGSFCAHPFVAHLLGVGSADTARLLHEAECGEDVAIPGAVRASIGLGTTRADIEAFLAAISEAEALTPA
jgi:selenocysteine lyase/cysteine desulfurase